METAVLETRPAGPDDSFSAAAVSSVGDVGAQGIGTVVDDVPHSPEAFAPIRIDWHPQEQTGTGGWHAVAEAVRKGSARHPHGRYGYFLNNKTCVLGALWVGLTGTTTVPSMAFPPMALDKACHAHTGVHLSQRVRHPCYRHHIDTVWSIAIDLNDTRYWSRERIANWLETLPPPESGTQV